MNNLSRHSIDLSSIYEETFSAGRGSPLFSAFPYPTKIDPETIALFIATHSNPGDVIFDGFAGSGSTGLATILCASPTSQMINEAAQLKLPVQWGARRAILYELSVLGAFIAQNLCYPPNPAKFQFAAQKLLSEIENKLGWMYHTNDPDGKSGRIRHVVWTEYLICPNCSEPTSFWDCCVKREPASITPHFRCPKCGENVNTSGIERLTETKFDELIKEERRIRLRRPAWLYGQTGKKLWAKRCDKRDLDLLKRIDDFSIPSTVPIVPIPWGDLYRKGYHQGISHLHHFYTRRNLIIFASLWEKANESPSDIRDALKFWLLSYNASHTTLMTRVVAKSGQKDLVVTSSQPGVLYISNLPVEKNLFYGLERKLGTIVKAFDTTHNSHNSVSIVNASCMKVDLPDSSVDYVFTDPPFGGNIPYSEVNFINEAWLGRTTPISDEITISPAHGKTAGDYGNMLTQAFKEVNRLLKPDGRVTVVFHSSSANVWNALVKAYEDSGLSVVYSSILNKTQGSFKQVTATGSVRGDPIMLLQKGNHTLTSSITDVDSLIDRLIQVAKESNLDEENSPQRLYSRFITYYLRNNQEIPIDADTFYRLLENKLRS